MDELDRHRFRNDVFSMMRQRQNERTAQTNPGYMGGPTTGQFGMMSATQPTAADQDAFTRKKTARAQLGQYGRGGLERETLANEMALREKMEAGALARERLKESGATQRHGLTEERERAKEKYLYHPGDGLTQRGIEQRKADAATQISGNESELKRKQLEMMYGPEGVERIKATRPEYEYKPKVDALGNPIEYQAFANGLPVGDAKLSQMPDGPQANRVNLKNMTNEDLVKPPDFAAYDDTPPAPQSKEKKPEPTIEAVKAEEAEGFFSNFKKHQKSRKDTLEQALREATGLDRLINFMNKPWE